MNVHAIRAIYHFEMARTFRTLMQSIASPVLSTALYFVVFGAAIGARMGTIDGVSYGAFIVPGLMMLSILSESVSNASFGIYLPKWSGTIFELLSAPVSYVEVLIGYVGAAATKSMMLGILILVTARLCVPYQVAHPVWMVAFLVLTASNPMMKPNRLKLTAVRTRKVTIQAGCAIWYGTHRRAVTRIRMPSITDLVAAAPT